MVIHDKIQWNAIMHARCERGIMKVIFYIHNVYMCELRHIPVFAGCTIAMFVLLCSSTSHILLDKESKVEYEGNVIDCSYGNWFWVRWSPMEVTVGHSPEVGESVIMTWLSEGRLPTIEAVEFDTPEGNGTWEFLDIEGLYEF